MDELRFDGRVAVVTGAGRGIGRAYARLLAARGAAVVVGDLGGSMAGDGADDRPAERVAAEIVDAGGVAVADTSDVSSAEGAAALVAAAVERFGRIDALVNNAGIMRWARFPDVDDASLERHLAVHLWGAFHTARAAWPHMVDQGYGRVVMTTSAGVFGLPDNTAYAAAKGGVIGLTRSLARAGRRDGISVNCIAPAAWTRMADPSADAPTGDSDGADEAEPSSMAVQMSPDLVAPMVAYLAHEDCPVTGEIYAAGAGRFSRIVLASTEGYLHQGSAPTVEDVAAHWATIDDASSIELPTDLGAWSRSFTAHLAPPDAAP